jgi:hypothetical protein
VYPRNREGNVRERTAIPAMSHKATEGSGTSLAVSVVFVTCPYCDGENVVLRRLSGKNYREATDREIACRHCQCLFSLSESKKGIRSGSALQPDAA